MRTVFLCLLLMVGSGVLAKDPVKGQDNNTVALKFELRGTTLVFDTENGVESDEAEMTDGDVKRLLKALKGNPGITELELNSTGGSVYAGDEMARIVIDFELDTVVSGECSSACVNVFLGGEVRRMRLGSKIGFHQRHWSPASIEKYYENNKDTRRWKTPFDFASWSYKDTQAEISADLDYFVARGVEPGFAIKAKQVQSSGMWYPGRLEMIVAGVLRE